MIIHKCDRCGAQTEPTGRIPPSLPIGWLCLRITITNRGESYERVVCPTCANKLYLDIGARTEKIAPIADRLLDIVHEIATHAAEQVVDEG